MTTHSSFTQKSDKEETYSTLWSHFEKTDRLEKQVRKRNLTAGNLNDEGWRPAMKYVRMNYTSVGKKSTLKYNKIHSRGLQYSWWVRKGEEH